MEKQSFKFNNSTTDFYFSAHINNLVEIVETKNAIIITDENVFTAHSGKFKKYKTIVLKPGEEYKVQATVDSIIQQLIAMEADRKTVLVGVGGGVITDITGYVASTYMRGLEFGFVPTTLLALVDASIGGKNGIDVGVYKNIIGVTKQPTFILHDLNFLKSLPESQWQNGFAEIIKHACIKDAAMFKQLQERSIDFYMSKRKEIDELIQRNVKLKLKVVQNDEFEKGERKLLNFGHTLGHALENQYDLMHGQAVAIGITYASKISQQLCGFKQTDTIVNTLELYGLPTNVKFDKKKVFQVLKMDKKRERKDINFILLEKVGKGIIQPIALRELEEIIQSL
jgi:3-dehydroquinate synthase